MNEYLLYTMFLIYSCYLFLSVFREIETWKNTFRLYGTFPLRIFFITIQSVYRSSNKFHLLSPLLVNVPIAAFILYFPRDILHGLMAPRGILPDWVVILPSVLYTILIILHLALPPSVLLLGNSRWPTVRLCARIERGIFPYRVITFLDEKSAEPISTSWLSHGKFRINNLWLQKTDNWRTVIFYIIKNVPLVVLDTRIPSPAVVDETEFILSENLSDKVLFIMTDEGTTPSINAVTSNAVVSNVTTCTPQTIVKKLRDHGLQYIKSPNNLPGIIPTTARRISEKLQEAGAIIEYFGQSILSARNIYGNMPFIQEANSVYYRLVTGAGTFSELDKNMVELQKFINRWESDQTIWLQSIVRIAKTAYQAIGDMQIAIDTAPEGLVDEKQAKFNQL